MNDLYRVARPGLMLSQVWPTSRETRGATARALELALETGTFRSFQSVEIPYADERKTVAYLLGEAGVPYTYCLARVLNENRLNLADLDDANRKRSRDVVVHCLDDAREAGADSVSLVSGPRPSSEQDRPQALERLRDSLQHIVERGMESPGVSISIEFLDVDRHKKMALGYTAEAVKICQALKEEGLALWLTLDTSHIILNGESPAQALSEALAFTADFHYANCVLDPSNPWHGDHHLRFGPPGVVDIQMISDTMRHQVAIGFFAEGRKPPIMCEVLLRNGENPEALMRYCIQTMQKAWELASERESQEKGRVMK